jgi:hypothetical protein
MVVPFIAFVAACGVALVFAIQHVRREPPVDTKTAATAPAVSKPASGARDQVPAALAAAQADMAAALAGSPPPPDSGDGVPAFDIARIEPTGEAVIAGRATPGATVELLRNGELHDRAVADQSGQFAMVPPRLPPGTYDLTLRSKQPDGKQATSKQSVAVALEPSPNDRPLVALMTPDKPTVMPSQPAAAKPMAGALVVEAVESEPGGKLHMSGRARPGAAVRLYLNDSFVASVTASADGRFAVTINEGIAPGSYRSARRRFALRRGRAEDRDHHRLPRRQPLAHQPPHLRRGHALRRNLQGEPGADPQSQPDSSWPDLCPSGAVKRGHTSACARESCAVFCLRSTMHGSPSRCRGAAGGRTRSTAKKNGCHSHIVIPPWVSPRL